MQTPNAARRQASVCCCPRVVLVVDASREVPLEAEAETEDEDEDERASGGELATFSPNK
jgi:hypothetical protein